MIMFTDCHKNPTIVTYSGSARCSERSLVREPRVFCPKGRCSDVEDYGRWSLVRKVFSPTGRYSEKKMGHLSKRSTSVFRTVFVPKSRYSECHVPKSNFGICPKGCLSEGSFVRNTNRGRCSEGFLVRRVDVPKVGKTSFRTNDPSEQKLFGIKTLRISSDSSYLLI